MNDYLNRLKVVDKVKEKLKKLEDKSTHSVYQDFIEKLFMPWEFAAAAFRFGHSMVGEKYNLNERAIEIPLFSANGENDLREAKP